MSELSLLNVENLSGRLCQRRAKQHAVNGVSFHIKHGETVGLVGESGSGKSVSALSILKLLPYPTAFHESGKIYFDDVDLMAHARPCAALGARQSHFDDFSRADVIAQSAAFD